MRSRLRRRERTMTITHDPFADARDDDVVLRVPQRRPRLSHILDALKRHGPVVPTRYDRPSAWTLTERPSGTLLAVVESYSGENILTIHPAADPSRRIARDAPLHLGYVRQADLPAAVDNARQHLATTTRGARTTPPHTWSS